MASRLAARSAFSDATPVTLPAGRLRLVTRPSPIGSPPVAKTTGTVAVACLAASAAGALPGVTITATSRRTRSAASSGSRSALPSAQRYSIATSAPSAKPASVRPRRKPSSRLALASGEPECRKPITGSDRGCARPMIGQVAAAARTPMNARRQGLAIAVISAPPGSPAHAAGGPPSPPWLPCGGAATRPPSAAGCGSADGRPLGRRRSR